MNLEKFIEENNCLTNMTEYVEENNITNVGLEDEVKKLIKGLSRMKKSNVLILGKPGIGKTALVEKLCEMINNDEVPEQLKDKIVLELSLGGAVAGTRFRGDFEEKITNILDFIKDKKNIILFIDEVHNVISAGGAEGAINSGDILKPYLARSNISLIGATTLSEYKKTIKTDGAMDRRFVKLKMNEPSVSETIDILEESKVLYENYYGVNLTHFEIINIVFRSKYKKGYFPDKAFDCLESYCYEKSENLCR